MDGYVYIIQSQKSLSYYVGSTSDVQRRLRQHNSGNVTATKFKRPYQLVFSQKYQTIEIAQKIERKIKSWKRRDFIEKIIEERKIGYMGD